MKDTSTPTTVITPQPEHDRTGRRILVGAIIETEIHVGRVLAVAGHGLLYMPITEDTERRDFVAESDVCNGVTVVADPAEVAPGSERTANPTAAQVVERMGRDLDELADALETAWDQDTENFARFRHATSENLMAEMPFEVWNNLYVDLIRFHANEPPPPALLTWWNARQKGNAK